MAHSEGVGAVGTRGLNLSVTKRDKVLALLTFNDIASLGDSDSR